VSSIQSYVENINPRVFQWQVHRPFPLCLFPCCLRLLVTFCPAPSEGVDLAPTLSESCSLCRLPKFRKYEQFIHTNPNRLQHNRLKRQHVSTVNSHHQALLNILVNYSVSAHMVSLFSLAYPGILFGGVQQIPLREEGRENGDLGGGSRLVRGSAQFADE
jgi:hypothetical protein